MITYNIQLRCGLSDRMEVWSVPEGEGRSTEEALATWVKNPHPIAERVQMPYFLFVVYEI